MKKLVLFLALLILACSKKQIITGTRKDVFISNTSFEVRGDPNTIILEEPQTFKNYYGDSSLLNKPIGNYQVNNLDFETYIISTKKFGTNFYYFSSPVVVNGTIYFLDSRGFLHARELNNLNKDIWKIKLVDRQNNSNYYGGKISFANDTIFAIMRINDVIAVSTEGKIKWKKKINSVPISVPVVDEGTVYIITNDNKLYALDEEDGKIEWIHYGNPKDSAILGAANPVVYGDYVVASYSSGELFILNKETGDPVFNMNLTGKYMIFSNFELTDIDSTPVVKDNILIATGNNGITVAIDLSTLRVLWKQNIPSLTNLIVNNNSLFLMTTDNIILCMDIKTGAINWSNQLPKFNNPKKKKDLIFYRGLILLNDKLVAFNNFGQYKIIEPKNGEVANKYELSFIPLNIPFSLDGRLYGIGVDGGRFKLFRSK